ncbi:hypothetical protein [uncultured Selenomonas sp.]|uniref:hypothetical protein n=1 Tax=uncultured Selenomonas sp. TaxID=159275 RepID=UPI0025D7992A|nr:hypothetical protein [uncultured Selenomonas sp.]
METKQLHVTPATMITAIFEIAHESKGDAKYDEVAERFFALASSHACAAKAEMQQSLLDHFYELEKDAATAWVADLIKDAHMTQDTVLELIQQVFEKHGDRSIRFA